MYPNDDQPGERKRSNSRKTKLRGRQHSVHAEPTMAAMRGKLDARPDETVSKAHARIDDEHLGESFAAEAERSVFDEPVFSEKLHGEVPENALTYSRYLIEKRNSISLFESWFLTGLFVLGSGVFAIAGSLFGSLTTMGWIAQVEFIAVAVVAPVVEEVMKTALLLWGVEQRPYWFRSPAQLIVVGLFSGLMFAAIENVLYLTVYIDSPSPLIIIWRWTVCVALHSSATLIATIGLVKIWKRVMSTGNFARAEIGAPYLFAAILLHGIYNGAMYLLGVIAAI